MVSKSLHIPLLPTAPGEVPWSTSGVPWSTAGVPWLQGGSACAGCPAGARGCLHSLWALICSVPQIWSSCENFSGIFPGVIHVIFPIHSSALGQFLPEMRQWGHSVQRWGHRGGSVGGSSVTAGCCKFGRVCTSSREVSALQGCAHSASAAPGKFHALCDGRSRNQAPSLSSGELSAGLSLCLPWTCRARTGELLWQWREEIQWCYVNHWREV